MGHKVCDILCLSETWLTTSGPDTAVMPSDNFSVLRMDRTAEAGKTKGGGVCFIINKKWCDPRNISTLSHTGILTKARSGTPGGESSDALVLGGLLLMTSTGTCSGRVRLTSASSRM